MIWYQIIPYPFDNFQLKIHICIHKNNLDIPQLQQELDVSEKLISLVHTQDIGGNDHVWNGLKAPLTTQGRLSTFEKSIWQMNRWWLSKMELSKWD